MSHEELIKDIIQSNAMLRVQIWVLGGVLSLGVVVLIGMARATWLDVKTMLHDHEERLKEVEEAAAVLNDRYHR